MEPLIVALDYETYYSKSYSVSDLGNYAYTRHPEFYPYMLTAATECGDTWSGDPLDFDYTQVNGATCIFANAGFDCSVTDALIESGKIPRVKFGQVFDVLDLARYLGFPGNLAGASEQMLGKKLDKGVRDSAKGRHWVDMTPEQQDSMRAYAIRDAVVTLEIWQKYNHLWPEHEREISRLTREMCARGVPIDLTGLNKDIESLETLLWKVRTQIPWAEDPDAPILSKKQVAIECRKQNVEPPKSMAKDSDEFTEWLRKHGDNFQWARAIGSYRSVNMQLERLRSMRRRTKDFENGTGVMIFGLKYFGGHTGRDSGDQGVNVQNFSKLPMFEKEMRELHDISIETNEKGKFIVEPDKVYGIDMRGKIMAPVGKKLGVLDLAAIEPCCLADLSGDEEMCVMLREGMDPYESQARIAHGYVDPRPLKDVDSDLRAHMKVDVLGMGYGAGPDKIQIIAKMMGLTLSYEEAAKAVFKFRSRKFIPNLWTKLEGDMRRCTGGDFRMPLPSGREMLYRNVKAYGSLSAEIPRNGKLMRLKFWGGFLTENLIQASAREVFMDRVLALAEAGFMIILRVHDEVVLLLDEATAEQDLQRAVKIMSTTPSWWPTLPIRAEGHVCTRYHK